MNVRKPIALQRLGERSVQRAGRHGRDGRGSTQRERAGPAFGRSGEQATERGNEGIAALCRYLYSKSTSKTNLYLRLPDAGAAVCCASLTRSAR